MTFSKSLFAAVALVFALGGASGCEPPAGGPPQTQPAPAPSATATSLPEEYLMGAPLSEPQEALCDAVKTNAPSVGLPASPWVCYVESDVIPGGCASCFVAFPLPVVGATQASLTALAQTLPGGHVELVRSPMRVDRPTNARRLALVFGVTQE